MNSTETQRVTVIAGRLAELLERERRLVEAGRLVELTQLVEEREEVARELGRMLEKGRLPEGELRDRVAELSEGVRRNLILLLSVRDELSRALRHSQQLQRAVEHYARG